MVLRKLVSMSEKKKIYGSRVLIIRIRKMTTKENILIIINKIQIQEWLI